MLRRITILSLAIALAAMLFNFTVLFESVDAPISQDSIQAVAGTWDD